jgi:GxxExxY protein
MLQHEELTGAVLGAAIEVHNQLGPGLLESAYEECLCLELTRRGVAFERQVPLSVTFQGINVGCGYRLDLIVGHLLVVELKAIDGFLPIHEAQLLTYMRLGNFPVGLMINFNVRKLKDGILRRVI